MNVHHFPSTGEAYDATQCDERIKNGDILVIESEQVVGLADTWPIAITVAHGELHRTKAGCTVAEYLLRNDDLKACASNLEAARLVAKTRGWECAP